MIIAFSLEDTLSILCIEDTLSENPEITIFIKETIVL